MNKVEFLQRLFQGFVVNFESFKWYTTSNYSDITAKELGHFSELGERLGFCVRREMNWEYPRDLCWVDGTGKKSKPYLYMERESKNARMEHTIIKMLNPENFAGIPFLVASFGHLTQASYEEALSRLESGVEAGQSALLFAWVAEKEETDSYDIRASVTSGGSTVSCAAIPYLNENTQCWAMKFSGGEAVWR